MFNLKSKEKFPVGFSLIEMMAVVLIFSLVLAAVYMLYSQGTLSWYTTDTNIEVTENARRAMDAMIRDLANSANSTCTISFTFAADDTITFRLPTLDNATGNITWGNDITYLPSGAPNRQLIRREGGTDRILCNNVAGITFNRHTTAIGTIINIILQTSKTSLKGHTLSANLTSGVKLRNE